MSWTTIIIASAAIGAIIGLAPLIYGRHNGHPNLALGGFVSCLFAGLGGGIIPAMVVGAGFGFFLYRRVNGRETAAPRAAAAGEGEQAATTWDKMKHIRPWAIIMAVVLPGAAMFATGLAGYGIFLPVIGLIGNLLIVLWLYVRCTNLGVSAGELFPRTPGKFSWPAMWGGLLVFAVF